MSAKTAIYQRITIRLCIRFSSSLHLHRLTPSTEQKTAQHNTLRLQHICCCHFIVFFFIVIWICVSDFPSEAEDNNTIRKYAYEQFKYELVGCAHLNVSKTNFQRGLYWHNIVNQFLHYYRITIISNICWKDSIFGGISFQKSAFGKKPVLNTNKCSDVFRPPA